MKETLSILLLFLIFSCSTSQKVVKEEKCPKIYKNKYTEILNEKYETIYNKDTISFNEIRFECIHSAFYTHKIMFDKFGKWDKSIYQVIKNIRFYFGKKLTYTQMEKNTMCLLMELKNGNTFTRLL